MLFFANRFAWEAAANESSVTSFSHDESAPASYMTFYLAIWGAVLATVTFIWNIWKWRQESPHIVEKVEAIRSLRSENNYAGIRLTLRNRGGKRTTVEKIFINRRPRWLEFGLFSILLRLRREVVWQQNVGVSNPKTAKLPVILDANEVWDGFIPFESNDPENEDELRQIDINRELIETVGSGSLRYSIQCAHTNHRIRGMIESENDSLEE